MTSVGPVDHIAREIVPWRTDVELTECGITIGELEPARVVPVEEIQRRVRDLGQQRAAYTTCMTCWGTADRWHRAGQRNRLGAIRRELEGLRYVEREPTRSFPEGQNARADRAYLREVAMWERRKRFDRELDALLALIGAHPDEFAELLAAREQAASLADARARRARRTRTAPVVRRV